MKHLSDQKLFNFIKQDLLNLATIQQRLDNHVQELIERLQPRETYTQERIAEIEEVLRVHQEGAPRWEKIFLS